MINCSLICKSKHWSVRLVKINALLKNILKYQKDLNFKKTINYDCNLILANNQLIKEMNYRFRNKNKATDVLTFISIVDLKKRKNKKFVIFFYLQK